MTWKRSSLGTFKTSVIAPGRRSGQPGLRIPVLFLQGRSMRTRGMLSPSVNLFNPARGSRFLSRIDHESYGAAERISGDRAGLQASREASCFRCCAASCRALCLISKTMSELSKVGVDKTASWILQIDEAGLSETLFEFAPNPRVPEAFTPTWAICRAIGCWRIVDSKGSPIRFGANDRAAGTYRSEHLVENRGRPLHVLKGSVYLAGIQKAVRKG